MCPIPDCARAFSVFSNLKRHMIVHPSVDFRGITVHDLPNFGWVDRPFNGGPAGLRWRTNGQLVGSGMVRGVQLTTATAGRRPAKKRGKGGVRSKGKARAESEDEEEGEEEEEEEGMAEDGDEGVAGERDDNGGWGPGSDADGDAESSLASDEGEGEGGGEDANFS